MCWFYLVVEIAWGGSVINGANLSSGLFYKLQCYLLINLLSQTKTELERRNCNRMFHAFKYLRYTTISNHNIISQNNTFMKIFHSNKPVNIYMFVQKKSIIKHLSKQMHEQLTYRTCQQHRLREIEELKNVVLSQENSVMLTYYKDASTKTLGL